MGFSLHDIRDKAKESGFGVGRALATVVTGGASEAMIAAGADEGDVVGAFTPLTGISQRREADKAREEARKAAEKAEATAREAEALIAGSEAPARAELEGGAEAARQAIESRLGRGDDILSGQLGELRSVFQQERDVGSAALQRLQDVILGGDMSQLELDPGFEFRRSEGEKAIERAAAAAGSFGSGANLKDFMRFNQGLASEEFGAAIGRLFGLQGIGAQANRSFAGFSTGIAQSRAGLQESGARMESALESGTSSNIANLITGTAANRANALQRIAAMQQQAGLQDASLGFQAGTAVPNAFNQGAITVGSILASIYGGPQAGMAVNAIGQQQAQTSSGNFASQQPNYSYYGQGPSPVF
jgi:hypothetical protein